MHDRIHLPSNRAFGALFILVFALLAAWQYWLGTLALATFWLSLAVVTAGITIVRPKWLAPFNRAWMALGYLLGRIVSPLVLGIMYAVLIVPVGLVMRIVGRDVMHRRYESKSSYWLERADGLISAERFKNQF